MVKQGNRADINRSSGQMKKRQLPEDDQPEVEEQFDFSDVSLRDDSDSFDDDEFTEIQSNYSGDEFSTEDNINDDSDALYSDDYENDYLLGAEINNAPRNGHLNSKALQEKYLAPTDSENDDDFAVPPGHITIGNVPVEWYENYPHIGYSIDGKKVLKPATKDELDNFLSKLDDPDHLATFHDASNHQDVKLTEQELEIISRLQKGYFPDAQMDPYADQDDFFTRHTEVMSLSSAPEPKRRFLPSKWEHKTVMKIVRAIRKGLIVPNKKALTDKVKASMPINYDIWKDVREEDLKDRPMHIPAPKVKLPTHAESYNPPEEYLFDEQELKEWLVTDPEDRRMDFIPKKHDNLRSVGGYQNLVYERFGRCLDLYLCPRAIRKRVIDPDSMLPELPNLRDLEPFPKAVSFSFKGHAEGLVRTFSIDPSGQWMVSGGDDKVVKVWECLTGRCIKTFQFADAISCVAWNPNKNLSLIAVACGKSVYVINPLLINDPVSDASNALLNQENNFQSHAHVKWCTVDDQKLFELGARVKIEHGHLVQQVTWHKKGDYLASLCKTEAASALHIHQLSKASSQTPLSKSPGNIQKVLFHPTKPILFVATQRQVRVYNLMRQELEKKLDPNTKWISSISIQNGGDNLLVGTFDKKVCWFDMDLSVTPYKNLRPHNERAVRDVAFHPRHPLFASCGDDGAVQIFHGMVFTSLIENPKIVPVKKIHVHKVKGGVGVLHNEFHPFRPWLLTSGCDGCVKLSS
ncbi:hypothetical protein MIR68_008966 [Amoeboaphelidium protococcarum]|nr:hypothetical protein MIR68_008966 [Amoeboaphelidium protococcarum]